MCRIPVDRGLKLNLGTLNCGDFLLSVSLLLPLVPSASARSAFACPFSLPETKPMEILGTGDSEPSRSRSISILALEDTT
uniref:Uncharacterized protein n=1 Tax=Anguilla anguilla TaxID=7936 RepID=A0A0E9W8G0_ANGAN